MAITDNDLRLMGSRTATAAAYASGAPSGYPAGQAITATAVSTNTIDLSVAREIGSGKQLYALFTVTGAFTRGAGAIDTVLSVIIDDDPALGSPTVIAATGTIAKADLALGDQVALAIPPIPASLGLRYLGASVTNANNADSAALVCDIVDTLPDGAKFYPSGITIL
jgi:hypothetical protein